jgi:iron complex outermembrane receptor protein
MRPISVKAFTEAGDSGRGYPDAAGLYQPHDADVTLVQTQNAGNSFLNIRGVSQARNSELSAAVLIDGVLMSNPTQFNQQLFDIEQIEVLRGPAGRALWPQRHRRRHHHQYQAARRRVRGSHVEAGVDSGPGYRVRGIGERTAHRRHPRYRLSGSYMDTDGFINNNVLGEEADPVKDASARLQA